MVMLQQGLLGLEQQLQRRQPHQQRQQQQQHHWQPAVLLKVLTHTSSPFGQIDDCTN